MAFNPDDFAAPKSGFNPDNFAAPVQQPQPSYADRAISGLGNFAAGGLQEAGNIGATILSPLDYATRKLRGGEQLKALGAAAVTPFNPSLAKQLMAQLPEGSPLEIGGYDILGQDRRGDINDVIQSTGADQKSLPFKAGQIATGIAGTAGMGGLLGKGVLAAAPNATKLAAALESGGLSGGANLPTRMLAGSATGGASAGLINPDEAKTGALIGGAIPVSADVLGAALKQTLGATTGVGSEPISQAYQAGKQGNTDLLENMRGNVGFGDVVDKVKQGLSNMRQDRSQAYQSGMVDIGNDKTILDLSPIHDTLNKVEGIGNYKGFVTNKSAAGTVDELRKTIEQFTELNPTEYHTPEGLDQLKQAIGDIKENTQMGTASRRAADMVYNSVREQITKQAPVYDKVMKDYSQASDILKETEKTLSVGKNASEDTAIRKLQSLMRNNAQSNYGNRMSLARNLEESGGVYIMPSIAGQSLNSWMPRGMTGAIEKAGVLPTAVAMATGHLPMTAALAAPLASPRLAGEGAYLAGQLASTGIPSAIGKAAPAAVASLQNLSDQQRLAMALMTEQQKQDYLKKLGAQ